MLGYAINSLLSVSLSTLALHERYMDEHGIDVHCLVPLPWLECEPGLHADETKALEVLYLQYNTNIKQIHTRRRFCVSTLLLLTDLRTFGCRIVYMYYVPACTTAVGLWQF